MRIRTAIAAAVLAAALPASAQATTFVVHPGESIQAAVDKAHKGDTVKVKPGTYREDGRDCPAEEGKCAVVIRKSGIKLVTDITEGEVVIKRKGNQHQGIAVAKTGKAKCLKKDKLRVKGSLIRGFTVLDFPGDGVFLFCVDKWRITEVKAKRNSEYGIFPSHVGEGRVDHSFASGSNDTGIYVGQSHNVRIDHNLAQNNVSGFEIENSRFVVADHNVATHNTAGILSFALPGLDVKRNHTNSIFKNDVRNNNRKNTCIDQDDTVCEVPPGSGILLVAADKNEVEKNTVKGNKTVGIALASYCIITGSSSTDCTDDIEPNPDDNRVINNVATGNGNDPDPDYEPFASDLTWDTTGEGNCWSGNTFEKSFPSELPACAG